MAPHEIRVPAAQLEDLLFHEARRIVGSALRLLAAARDLLDPRHLAGADCLPLQDNRCRLTEAIDAATTSLQSEV